MVTHEGNPLRVVQDKAAFMDMIATSRHWFDLSLVQELSERTKAATAGKGGSGGGKETKRGKKCVGELKSVKRYLI